MPDSVSGKSVAIIGAGIVGVSTAIWLQRAGHRVVLVDRKGPAEGTSYGNGGVLASASIVPETVPGLIRRIPRMLLDPDEPLFLKWRYLPRALPWFIRHIAQCTAERARRRASALYPILGDSLADHQALAAGTGAEKWIVPSDFVFLYRDRERFERGAFGWQLRRDHGFTWEELEGERLRDYDPNFSAAIGFGVRLPDHGHITDPGRYVKDLAAHVERAGGRLVIGEASDVVRERGRVTGIRLGGETLPCDAAVVAAGAWSRVLAAKLGASVPLESERGYHLELWEPSLMPRSPVMVATGSFVATPMDGRLRLAGIAEFGGLDAPPSDAPFELLERQIRAAMPGLSWKHADKWMGHRPVTVDSTPVIGPVPGVEDAFLGFGHDHVGLTGGPKTGRLLAQLVSGDRPNIDLAPYRADRF